MVRIFRYGLPKPIQLHRAIVPILAAQTDLVRLGYMDSRAWNLEERWEIDYVHFATNFANVCACSGSHGWTAWVRR